MNRDKKEQEINFLKDGLKNYASIVIASYSGLNVEKFSQLRKDIKSNGSLLKVFKNTLSLIAFKDTYAGVLSDYLEGPNFLLLTNDPSDSAKVLLKFIKDNPDNIEIKAGYYKDILDKNQISILAALPPKEILVGKFISILKSPGERFVFALKYPQIRLLRVLEAIKMKKSA